MKKRRLSSTFIIIFQIFCIHAWSAEEDANQTKVLLSNKNVSKRITIQVVSLKDENKASQELARLKSRGLEAFMRHETVGDKGMWYRIYVGQFTSRKKATLFAQKLKNQGTISDYWVKTITVDKELETTPLPVTKPPEQPKIKVDAEKTKPFLQPAPIEISKPIPPPDRIPLIPPPELPSEKPKEPEKVIVQKPPVTEKEMLPSDVVTEEEELSPPSSIAVQRPKRHIDDGRFSLGVRSSYFHTSKADEFKIERNATNDNDTWSFQNEKMYNALVSSFLLNPKLSLEVAIEKAFFTKLDLWNLTMGPKINFKKINILTPHIRGGLVIGHLEWDDAPGDFDPAIGLEGGLGISFIKSNFQLGIEAVYRAIEYDYNKPSDDTVTATDSALDLTGYGVTVTVSYLF